MDGWGCSSVGRASDWHAADAGSIPRCGKGFFSQSQLCVLTLIRCPFHPRVIATARKRPRSFCQKCKWQATPIMHTSLTQRSRGGLTKPLPWHSVGTYHENELTRNSSGNTRSQSSQLAEPLWTDLCLKSEISVRELISTHTKKNHASGE